MPDNNSTALEKLTALRTKMSELGVDGFIVPRADEYQGEFVAAYAERLMWLTGFSGSAGIAVVLQDRAVVMSDARYTLQLDKEVDLKHFDTADSNAEPPGLWLNDNASDGMRIGYDPMLLTSKQLHAISSKVADKSLEFEALDENLIDMIWDDQPVPPKAQAIIFPSDVAGQTIEQKKQKVIDAIESNGGFAQVLGMPDSVAWLLNIRGDDVPYMPAPLSYAIINAQDGVIELLIDADKIPADVKAHLGNSVEIYPLDDLEWRLQNLAQTSKEANKPVFLDDARCPDSFQRTIKAASGTVQPMKDPCVDMRACKTDAEIEAIKQAHILDGVAITKFLYWLDQMGESWSLDEIQIDEKLQELRGKSEAYRGPSFPTIAGFADNGAVIHYRATKHSAKKIDKPGLLLVDSGGQYEWGTTDVTRTIAIGEPTEEMRKAYTSVLKGHIALAMAKFPKGTTGVQLDSLARAPLWAEKLDYAHGTGHGVGCYLSVHEDAANISPRSFDPLMPGMLLSNEPGYYKAGEFGIRIENLVLVHEVDQGSAQPKPIYSFDTVSFAPFDKSLIMQDMLSVNEKAWLSTYNNMIAEHIMNNLDNDEQSWLKQQLFEG